MSSKSYYVGLDIGTSSCGIAAADEGYNILRAHGKDLWAVRLFDEAESKEARRQKRAARRRLERRRLRLRLLQDIFASEIAAVDSSFYARMQFSALESGDLSKLQLKKYILFNDEKYTDRDFYHKYPTIYHLRNELVNNGSSDIRELFLAIKHLIKYRGHFLFEGQTFNSFSSLKEIICNLNLALKENYEEDMPLFSEQKLAELDLYLQKKDRDGITKTEEKVSALLQAVKANRIYVKLFCGASVSLKALFFKDEYKDLEINKIKFSDADCDKNMSCIRGIISESEYIILEACKIIFDYVTLAKIKSGHNYLCEAMVAIYDKHSRDLKLLKNLVRKHCNEKYYSIFRDVKQVGNYCSYVGMNNSDGLKVKVKSCKQEDFHKFIKKTLNDVIALKGNEDFEYIITQCDNGTFMPKIINEDGGKVPHQLNLLELNRILEKSSANFPFLLDCSDGISNKDKILSLLTFRVPYFVGPLNPYHSIDKNGHAWVVRKNSGTVTPWNFHEKVDIIESAKSFMDKLIGTCSYIKGEKVLPRNSVLYCKFNVLNQLNCLKVNDSAISVELKQQLFDELFMVKKKISQKDILNFLLRKGVVTDAKHIKLSGLADLEVLASMKSLIAISDILGFCDENIAEDIILWHTLFTDKNIVEHFITEKYGADASVIGKLKELKGLSFNDFGKLSKMFLEQLNPININAGEVYEDISIINLLYTTNMTLMEILNCREYNFLSAIDIINGSADSDICYDDVEQMYISPLVKRSVWQAISMIKEYVDVLGCPPKKIFVEVARTNNADKKKKLSRLAVIKDLYNACSEICEDYNQLMAELNKKQDSDLRQERLYLYFRQLGRCAYSDSRIDLAALSSDIYDVDHIIPQSMVKDDSLDNKVLVKRELNQSKSDKYPLSSEIINVNLKKWQIWLSKGLITQSKFNRLTKRELNAADFEGFIARQMVVTNQSAKAVCELLKKAYKNTAIVYSKAENISEFRQKFDIAKSREVNNLHHAVDAYLNIVVGNVFHTKFGTDIRAFFRNRDEVQRIYNLKKLYDNNIDNAWDYKNTLSLVKATVFKNSMQVTRFSFTVSGAFYDETVYSKESAEFPMKGENHFLSAVDNDGKYKYGGYKKLKNAYFMLVQSKNKKGLPQLTLEGMPVIFDYNIKDDIQKKLEFCKNFHGLKEPVLVVGKIKIQSLLKVDGTLCYLSGKTGDRIVVRGANEWFVDNSTCKYFKDLEKFSTMYDGGAINKDVALKNMFEVSPSKNKDKIRIISKEKNLLLYDKIISQLDKKIYGGLAGYYNVGMFLKEKRNVFVSLDLISQARQLLRASVILKCTAESTDLVLLGGSAQSGILAINKNITDKKFSIVSKSITGVFQKEVVVSKGKTAK